MKGIIILIKLANTLRKLLRIGHGSTWPGHIALSLNGNILKNIILKNPKVKIVLVSGTNGKTTTSLILTRILESKGFRVLHNDSGANLLNGVASKVLLNTSFDLQIPYDYIILEVDENSLEKVIKNTDPAAIILLNLFRDQLDRYGEVNTVAKKWTSALKHLSKSSFLIANADDPQVKYTAEKEAFKNRYYFSIEEPYFSEKKLEHDTDSIFCPNCKSRLAYSGIVFSHLGKYKCLQCKFARGDISVPSGLSISIPGVYNRYNLQAASKAATILEKVSVREINETLSDFKPAFGRQEQFDILGRDVRLLLAKNPTGFNQSIQTILDMKKNEDALIIALNDRIPDGRDISWIWDVEFENLKGTFKKIFLTGDRALDLVVRLKYAETKIEKPEGNFKKTLQTGLSGIKRGDALYILATYSAMLEIRDELKRQIA